MLNHASDVNSKRREFKSENKDAVADGVVAPAYPDQGTPRRRRKDPDPPVYNGKRLTELTSDEYVKYLKAGL
jgi:hypothetical protein